MKTKWIFGCFLALLSLSVLAGEGSENKRLLKPAFAFQLCVRNTTEAEISRLSGYKGKGSELEIKLWDAVIKECRTHLDDDEKGLILLHYGGSSAKALGFYEGLIYSARAYILSRSIDVTGN